MNYKTIAEIYSANDQIRQNLKEIVAGLTDEQLSFRPHEKSWTITEIVEHLAIVENGMAKISAKLLEKSGEENLPNDGSANLSERFLKVFELVTDRTNRKVEAPDRVAPKENLSIADSFAKMEENGKFLSEIREGLEKINTQKAAFPHPFFGDLSATEWLCLIGGHEMRHIDQIKEILST